MTGGYYTLNGRTMRRYSSAAAGNALRTLNSGGVYIVSRKLDNGRMAIVPFIRQ